MGLAGGPADSRWLARALTRAEVGPCMPAFMVPVGSARGGAARLHMVLPADKVEEATQGDAAAMVCVRVSMGLPLCMIA